MRFLRLDAILPLLLALYTAEGLNGYSKLNGVRVTRAVDGKEVDLLSEVKGSSSLLIFGTYAADFNAVEYAQRLRFYLPQLREKGVAQVGMILNGSPTAALTLARLVDLPETVTLYSDPLGVAGKAFGVSRGWLAEDEKVSPYLKLFGMLFGLGAWATLPSVLGGYIGNPFSAQPWIEDALAQGQRAERWPSTALVLEEGRVRENKFRSLPLVGGWGRRPLELATLRLQNMLGISLKHWEALRPSEAGLGAGVLTQLGGCVLFDEKGGVKFEWRDQGICNVAKFEDILKKL